MYFETTFFRFGNKNISLEVSGFCDFLFTKNYKQASLTEINIFKLLEDRGHLYLFEEKGRSLEPKDPFHSCAPDYP